MRTIVLLLLLTINGISFSADPLFSDKGKIYAFLVGDTYDRSVGNAADIDVTCMKKSLSAIGEGLNFKVYTTVLTGKDCDANYISKKIKHTQTTSNDIIIFYYTGHGYNGGEGSIWPVLCTHSDLIGSRVKRYLIHKKKRCAIILFDCCNSYIDKQKEPFDSKEKSKPFFLKKTDNLNGFFTLLLSFRGTVIVSASGVGETASFDNCLGSFFTRGFLKAIHELGSEKDVSWDNLCSLTRYKTNKIADDFEERHQHPIYRIN